MSLARAFTTRRVKQTVDLGDGRSGGFPQRSNTTVKAGHARGGSIRNKISAPQDLIHATNMLAYNAPDLNLRSASSASSSKASDDESDGAHTNASSPPTSPDVASAEDQSDSPEPNHLSCYFTAPGQKLPADIPAIPQRSPSHTKKASYDNLAQKQSLSRSSTTSGRTVYSKAGYSSFRASSSTTASSNSSNSYGRSSKPPVPSAPVPSMPSQVTPAPASTATLPQRKPEMAANHHPFGQELAQVSEIAEDFGVKDRLREIGEEEQWLVAQGLCLFRPDDYLTEVQGLFATFFKPEQLHRQPQPMWI